MGSVPCRNIAFAANGPCRSCCYAIDLSLQMLAHSMPVDSRQRNLRHLCYPKQVGPWAASGNDNSVRRQAAAPDIAQYLVQILLHEGSSGACCYASRNKETGRASCRE